MSRTRDGVFIDADGRGKKARDKIMVVTARCDDHPLPGQTRQRGKVRTASAHAAFVIQHHQQLVGRKGGIHTYAQGLLQLETYRHRLRHQRREIQHQQPLFTADTQGSGLAAKSDPLTRLAVHLE